MNRPKQRPNLRLGVLQVWVHGRYRPNSMETDEVNLLNVTVRCAEEGSEVWLNGPLIELAELNALREELRTLIISSNGVAGIARAESKFELEFAAAPRKTFQMKVRLTPDRLRQEHRYCAEVGRGGLEQFVEEITGVLDNFPVISPLPKVRG